jgi:hypothetical protein
VRTDVQSFAVAHLRRRPEPREVGGFVVGFDPATTSPYVNYATPLPGAEPTAVTHALAAALLDAGARSVWLEYTGEGSRRVYERVGFRPGGTRLYVSLEASPGVSAQPA